MKTLIGPHWHHLPTDEVLDLVDSNAEKGLDLFEVQHRQRDFGPNVVSAKRERSAIVRFLLQFHQPLIYILLAAGAVTALLREWVDSSVIFGVVLLNAVVGYIQETKAAKAIAALAQMMVTEATVLRAGERQRVSAAEIVPGDIVFLGAGDKVPADARLLQSRELQVDESALTGESVPVHKSPEVQAHDTVLSDRRNMLYASTLVTSGQGRAVVVATGDATEVGRISEMIATVEELKTPLTQKIAQFSLLLLYVILVLALLTFVVGIWQGQKLLETFMAAVAFAVAAIPEGLPAAVTIIMAIGVSRMARRRAIVRKLPAVETLGSTTVICSDKTGTLTQNQMTVQEVFAGDWAYTVSGIGYSTEGQVLRDGQAVQPADSAALEECLRAGVLANESRLSVQDGRHVVQGDPTEGALIVLAEKAGLREPDLRRDFPQIDIVPFESQNQYMATLHAGTDHQAKVAYVKGAAETILERCHQRLDDQGRLVALDADEISRRAEEMAQRGLRVLAFARRDFGADKTVLAREDLESGLVFLGLQGMIDPPREEVIPAVRACHQAGIKIKMITGDHPLTATAIAGRIGLSPPGKEQATAPAALTGKALAQISDQKLVEAADQTTVFARVSPEQKLRLVEALQARGHVVAMTGDGVNDAPALKQADIGVAMGITGTDVAKEAADIVLTDDNFATIEAAVEEGRGVFDNLTKFIVWTLPTNLGEGLVILLAIVAAAELPILPVQILWINMTTALFLGLTLAFEPKEPGIMSRPPRDPKKPILTSELITRIVMVGILMSLAAFGLFEWEERTGENLAAARTTAANVIVLVEMFYLFNCRSLTKSAFGIGFFSNLWLLVGVAGMVGAQWAFVYSPTMNKLFHTAPVSGLSWFKAVLLALLMSLVVGLEKWWRLRRSAARTTAAV